MPLHGCEKLSENINNNDPKHETLHFFKKIMSKYKHLVKVRKNTCIAPKYETLHFLK
jgi:hypothetical protein